MANRLINEISFHKLTEKSYNNMRQGILPQHRYAYIDSDELMDYMWLKPSDTMLKYDIFVDDSSSYIREEHPLLIFVRNGIGRSCNDFIPISVSNDPKILDVYMGIDIPDKDLYNIRKFIIVNKQLLQKFAMGEMHPDDFVDKLIRPMYVMNEGYVLLTEMATMAPNLTNLPMTIWVDEGATYQGHAPRIKFKASNEQRTTREYSTMTLTNPPTIENLPKKKNISNKDIEKLKQFVINNLENLLKLANGEIDYRTQFLPNVVKYSDTPTK